MAVQVSVSTVGVHIQVREQDGDTVHRRVVAPGSIVEGEWVETDVSGEPAAVQAAAAAAWTAEAVEAFRDELEASQPQAPVFTRIPKDYIWRRATDPEAEAMELMLAAQPARTRRIYEGANYVSTLDDFYPILLGGLTLAFGAPRALELLEPTE
jgi:hypothetical protein